jgi:hypothetical protein
VSWVRHVGSFALTLLADFIFYQPVLDFLISMVNSRVSKAMCTNMEVRLFFLST